MSGPKFIIEHMEEELFPWCLIEYSRIASAVGAENFMVTRLARNDLPYGTDSRSVLELGIPIERICLLDSEATIQLQPKDISSFDYILLGGILGNVDEFDMDKTSLLRRHGFPGRHLGHMQMTTDTAVKVAHIVLTKQIALEGISFVDRPDLVGPTGQRFVSDFRYIRLENGQPDIDPKILQEMERDFDLDQME